MIRYFKYLVILFTISTTYAQFNATDNRLYLVNEIKESTTSISNLEKLKLDNPQTLIGENYFWVLQFEETPDNETRDQLIKAGIQLFDYIPNKAYMASIHHSVTKDVLEQYGVNGIYILNQSDKISPLLNTDNLPWWIIKESGMASVYIHVFKGINTNEYENLFSNTGIENPKIIPNLHLAEISIPQSDILQLGNLPFVQYVSPIDPPGEKENDQGKTNHRSNVLDTDYATGLSFTGTGITIMLSDDGDIGNHIDYKNRVDQSQASINGPAADHGNHIAGTLAGAGNKDPLYRGMAPGAHLRVYDYTTNLSSNTSLMDFPNAYVNHGVVVTSTSYSNGCNAGYTAYTELLDQQTVTYPSLLHVFSAGNSGTSNCGYGAGSSWGNITGGHKMGKNVIAVGNATKGDVLNNSSSRGPGTDGRIKPELCGTGTSIVSTTDDPSENSYVTKTGTSMSAPGVAATISQLYDAYNQLYSTLPNSALIKATVLNTCDDLGNPGPDFRFGFGRINGRRAYELLAANQFIGGTVAHSATNNHNITVPANVKQVRILVYWHDEPGSISSNPSLVNNLNMVVTDPLAANWNPWVLNEAPNATTLDDDAVRGVDDLNNMEQVTLDDPVAGTYTVSINGFNVPSGPQDYYVVYEFLYDEVTLTYPTGGEHFVPGVEERIRWDSYGDNSNNFTLEYSTNNGGTWNTISSTINNADRYYDWTPPALTEGDLRMRISRGAATDMSDTAFSVIGVPTNLSIDTACIDEVALSWDPVTGATGYEVYMLGTYYMDPVGTTSATNFTVTGVNIYQPQWFSVRALGPDNALGRRAVAIELTTVPLNCFIANDVAAVEPIFPSSEIGDCFPLATGYPSVRIENQGLNSASGFDVYAQIDAGPPISEVFSGTLAAGSDTIYTFATPANLSGAGAHTYMAWVDYASDPNQFNDTTTGTYNVISSTTASLPIYENMETFSNCGTSANCANEICPLGNGWINLTNGTGDNIDWRVDNNGTPSTNSGPTWDFDPGTSGGKYIYTEASGGCTEQTAILLSPCIDLTSSGSLYLEFAYSMVGPNMGSLHVDVLSSGGGPWTEVWSISGEQAGEWNTTLVDLTSYAGNIINIRFVGITGDDYASDIALDGISIYEITSTYTFNPTSVCVDSIVTFTDASVGNITGWNWDFGANAVPMNASTQGPHDVYFTSSGSYDVTLTVTGPGGGATSTQTVVVDDVPVADFSYVINNLQVTFTNNSSNGSTYYWDFGDGFNTTSTSPIHNYFSGGTYTVTLTSTNSCSSDDTTIVIQVPFVGIETQDAGTPIHIFPNPNEGQFTIDLGEVYGEVFIEVLDLAGKMVQSRAWKDVNLINWELTGANGAYILRINMDGEVRYGRVLKK